MRVSLIKMGEGELDMSRIRELVRYPGLLGDTLNDARPEAIALIAALREGMTRRDRARVGFSAHTLHGLFALLGAKRATVLGRAFESWARSADHLAPSLDELEAAWFAALAELEEVARREAIAPSVIPDDE